MKYVQSFMTNYFFVGGILFDVVDDCVTHKGCGCEWNEILQCASENANCVPCKELCEDPLSSPTSCTTLWCASENAFCVQCKVWFPF